MTEPAASIFEEPRHVAVLRRLRLIKPAHRVQAFRRALMAMAVAWLPLALLCAAQAYFSGHQELLPAFFTDVAVHARFLLAVPILILSEYIILPRLDLTTSSPPASSMKPTVSVSSKPWSPRVASAWACGHRRP